MNINQEIALGMAQLCVRNTVIEKYHSEGKLTDAEMMAFNKEVANKLYTALSLIANPDKDEVDAAVYLFVTQRPTNWDDPQLDPGIRKAVARIRKEHKRH